MRSRFLSILVLWWAMFSLALAQSQDADRMPDASTKIDHQFRQVLKQLNLTVAQGQQVREIAQSNRLDFRAVMRGYLMAKKNLRTQSG
jgi:Spy/CpxP family protein refolding chaperone